MAYPLTPATLGGPTAPRGADAADLVDQLLNQSRSAGGQPDWESFIARLKEAPDRNALLHRLAQANPELFRQLALALARAERNGGLMADVYEASPGTPAMDAPLNVGSRSRGGAQAPQRGAAGGGGLGGGKAIGPGETNANAGTALNYLMQKGGLSRAQAAGIVGNLMQESRLNPTASGDGGTSHGIAQWHNERFTALQRFAAGQGKDWRDLQVQLDFLLHELNTSERGALEALRRTNTPAEAAQVFERHFERASAPAMGNRIANAERAARMA